MASKKRRENIENLKNDKYFFFCHPFLLFSYLIKWLFHKHLVLIFFFFFVRVILLRLICRRVVAILL